MYISYTLHPAYEYIYFNALKSGKICIERNPTEEPLGGMANSWASRSVSQVKLVKEKLGQHVRLEPSRRCKRKVEWTFSDKSSVKGVRCNPRQTQEISTRDKPVSVWGGATLGEDLLLPKPIHLLVLSNSDDDDRSHQPLIITTNQKGKQGEVNNERRIMTTKNPNPESPERQASQGLVHRKKEQKMDGN